MKYCKRGTPAACPGTGGGPLMPACMPYSKGFSECMHARLQLCTTRMHNGKEGSKIIFRQVPRLLCSIYSRHPCSWHTCSMHNTTPELQFKTNPLTAPAAKPPVLSISLSAKVLLPWSICAMIAKLRISSGGNCNDKHEGAPCLCRALQECMDEISDSIHACLSQTGMYGDQ